MRKILAAARRKGSRASALAADAAAARSSVGEQLDIAAGCIEDRLAAIDVQLGRCNADLLSLRGELSAYPADCTSSMAAKQKALMLLKRKKILQHHRDSLLYSQLSIDQAYIANDSVKIAHQTNQALEDTNNALRKSLESEATRQNSRRQKNCKIGTVADLRCELQDLNFNAQTTTELLLGGSIEQMDVGFGCEATPDLEAELQQLMESAPPISNSARDSVLPASRPLSSEVPGPMERVCAATQRQAAPRARAGPREMSSPPNHLLDQGSSAFETRPNSELSALEDITDLLPPIPKHAIGRQPYRQQLRN